MQIYPKCCLNMCRYIVKYSLGDGHYCGMVQVLEARDFERFQFFERGVFPGFQVVHSDNLQKVVKSSYNFRKKIRCFSFEKSAAR